MRVWTAGGVLMGREWSKGVLTSVQDYIESMDSRCYVEGEGGVRGCVNISTGLYREYGQQVLR